MINVASSEPITLNGACHCGSVRFNVTLPQGLATARRCNCSLCRMRGAVAVTSTPDDFRLISGGEHVATYRFNTMTAEHHFCRNCGIYTHHKRRSNPNELGVNAACLEGLSPFDFREITILDGERHPADHDGRNFIAGKSKKPEKPSLE